MAESDSKLCPYCGEEIKLVAVRCKHCQADLRGAPAPVAEKSADFDRGVRDDKREPSDDFEVRFLEFAYQTTATINVPSVAHALRLPTALVNDRLEDMAVRDVILREIDDEGNVYFLIPGRAAHRPANPPLTKALPGQLAPVGPPLESTAVAAMVLNVIIPGAGSLVAGRVSIGIAQLVMCIVSFPLMLVFIGFPMLLATWVWSLVTGIQILEEAKRRQTPQ